MKEQFQEPAYYRVAKDLKKDIEKGNLKPGDAIPSEAQLSRQYNVSRMTVRQGLSQLANIGYIKTVQGKGNFVARPSVEKLVLNLSEENLFNASDKISIKLLGVEVIKAGTQESRKLALDVSTKIIKVARLLSTREGPVAIDTRCLPYLKGKPILEKEIGYAAFPEVINHYSEILSIRNELSISPTLLSEAEANQLKAEKHLPALCLEQVLFAYNGTPLGWSKMICRGDRYTLQADSYPHSREL